ncbi:MAG: 2'-5' RNA ligase family protein [Ekhidna sp.]
MQIIFYKSDLRYPRHDALSLIFKYKHLERLYFIAIIPPEKIREEITQLKVLMAERFNSKQALKSPPHITLHMPFKWKDKKLDQLQAAMQKLNDGFDPLDVELNGFNFFDPRVVYVDVAANAALEEAQKRVVDVCRKDLKLDNGNYKNRPFRPHMTIGFRDLRKEMFFEAKKYFQKRSFEAAFQAEAITLLKHDGSKWRAVSPT